MSRSPPVPNRRPTAMDRSESHSPAVPPPYNPQYSHSAPSNLNNAAPSHPTPPSLNHNLHLNNGRPSPSVPRRDGLPVSVPQLIRKETHHSPLTTPNYYNSATNGVASHNPSFTQSTNCPTYPNATSPSFSHPNSHTYSPNVPRRETNYNNSPSIPPRRETNYSPSPSLSSTPNSNYSTPSSRSPTSSSPPSSSSTVSNPNPLSHSAPPSTFVYDSFLSKLATSTFDNESQSITQPSWESTGDFDSDKEEEKKTLDLFPEHKQKTVSLKTYKEGYLDKESISASSIFKNWRNRYFVVYERGKSLYICYFLCKTDFLEGRALNIIDLEGATITNCVKSKRLWVMNIQTIRGVKLFVDCKTEQNMASWIQTISNLVKKKKEQREKESGNVRKVTKFIPTQPEAQQEIYEESASY